MCARVCGNEAHLDRCYRIDRLQSATTHIPSKIWVLNTPRQGSLAQAGEPANGDKKKIQKLVNTQSKHLKPDMQTVRLRQRFS